MGIYGHHYWSDLAILSNTDFLAFDAVLLLLLDIPLLPCDFQYEECILYNYDHHYHHHLRICTFHRSRIQFSLSRLQLR